MGIMLEVCTYQEQKKLKDIMKEHMISVNSNASQEVGLTLQNHRLEPRFRQT